MAKMKPEQLNPTFCRNLRALRTAQNLTQRQLADALETSPSVIIDWEKGKKSPTLETVAKLSVVLKIDPLGLLGETTEQILSGIAG